MVEEESEPTDRYFLVLVYDQADDTRGQALAALHAEHVPALALSELGHFRVAYGHLRPKVLVIDVARPGREELDLIRTLRAMDVLGAMFVVMVADVAEQEIPVEMAEMIDVYRKKPVDWRAVAKTVIDLANARRPPSSGYRVGTLS